MDALWEGYSGPGLNEEGSAAECAVFGHYEYAQSGGITAIGYQAGIYHEGKGLAHS